MPSVAQIPRGAVLAGVGSGGGRWPEVMPELGRKGEQELAGLEGGHTGRRCRQDLGARSSRVGVSPRHAAGERQEQRSPANSAVLREHLNDIPRPLRTTCPSPTVPAVTDRPAGPPPSPHALPAPGELVGTSRIPSVFRGGFPTSESAGGIQRWCRRVSASGMRSLRDRDGELGRGSGRGLVSLGHHRSLAFGV